MHVFLDFEASSLAKDSYPIEVAWVFEDGREESFLIKPLPIWTDWDERAAAIHGILRAELEDLGMPVEQVGRHLLDVLSGHEVFASSPSWDGKWLSVLLRGAGLPRHALRLRDTDEAQLAVACAALRSAVIADDLLQSTAKAVIARVRAEGERQPVAHRALPDARHERQLWLEIGEAARREAAAYSSR
jgi:hypothetical protein